MIQAYAKVCMYVIVCMYVCQWWIQDLEKGGTIFIK